MRSFLAVLLLMWFSFSVQGGVSDPVEWSFSYENKGEGIYELIFEAEIEDPWYLYSHDIEPGGPIPTNIVFSDENGIERGEIIEQGEKIVEYEEVFDMDLGIYYGNATFREEIKVTEEKNIEGFIEYMACDGDQCTPPLEHAFSFDPESTIPEEKGSIDTEDEKEETSGWAVEPSGEKDDEKADVEPVSWSFDIEKAGDHEVKAIFQAEIEEGWYIYSPNIQEGGPIPTSFILEDEREFSETGNIEWDVDPEGGFDEVFEMEIDYFRNEVEFSQIYKVHEETGQLQGFVEYMACDDQQCTPPLETAFALDLPDGVTPAVQEVDEDDTGGTLASATDESSDTLAMVFLGGILGGLIALLTPCVFPMIMLTVSFFTNRESNNNKGIVDAGFYGISIVLIYVLFGFFLTLMLGPNTIQAIASNPWVNLTFFIVFVLFAMSFFGAFEMKLPNSWANKMDSQSEKGGFIGVFFMALTLVIVSFSCTGPILGTLLIEAAVGGGHLGPLIGIAGFAIAFAVPYVLFAIFPSLLQKLPQSGGWMNTIKVVLGFLILALAMRFLSIAARVAHWDFLSREVFIVVWIVLFVMLGFYLLGKLRFAYDSEMSYVSVPRLFMSIVAFGFAIYLVPGLWGAPLKLVSGWLPPTSSQEFNLADMVGSGGRESSDHSALMADRNYSDRLSCSNNLPCFFDYYEAKEYAGEQNKPLLIDFTGHSCANCDLMHAQVWSQDRVNRRLEEDFVVVQLYVDDRSSLPDDEYRYLGQKWQELQREKFQTISLPYYVVMDSDENLLSEPRGYDTNVDSYIEWLDQGLENFKNGNKLQTLK